MFGHAPDRNKLLLCPTTIELLAIYVVETTNVILTLVFEVYAEFG